MNKLYHFFKKVIRVHINWSQTKQNKKSIIKTIALFCIGILFLFVGCDEKKMTYSYENQKEVTALALTKSVYSDGKLQLYMPDLKGDFALNCYDADLQKMEGDFQAAYKDGIYTIKGETAEKISGIVLKGSNDRF